MNLDWVPAPIFACDRSNRPLAIWLCQSYRFDAKDSLPVFFDPSHIVTYIPLSLVFREPLDGWGDVLRAEIASIAFRLIPQEHRLVSTMESRIDTDSVP